MYGRWLRNSFIYLLILVAIVAIVFTLLPGGSSAVDRPLTGFIQDVKAGRIESVEVNGTDLTYKLKGDEQTFKSKMEQGDTVTAILQREGIGLGDPGFPDVQIKKHSFWSNVPALLFQFLPIIFIVAILFFFLRQAQGSNSQAMNFGKSKARMFSGTRPSVTFMDVAGVDEAKEELAGGGEFAGAGAPRVRALFDRAKRTPPCIVFIDEIDAVGRHRGAGLGGSHDEREQTLNQILVEMDGFDTSTNVIIVAATNRPDILDPALLRPGRFDRQVVLDRPDIRGRRAILEVHAKGKPLDSGVNMETLAKQPPGFSGADLATLVNEASILAARRGKKKVTMPEFDEAVDRVIAGPERKSRVISQREREIIAYHEAGPAMVGFLLPKADPPYKISIVSRGMAGGFTRFLPEEDRHLYSRSQFQDMLSATMGGLVAEEMVFGEGTTGPQDDLEQATKIARQMVTQWGMSERLGPRTFGRKEEMIFLGREITEQRNYSEKVAEEIDEEVRHIIDRAYATAKQVLTENRAKLNEIVER